MNFQKIKKKWFLTVFWGDLEGAGPPPRTQATSRSPALLGLIKKILLGLVCSYMNLFMFRLILTIFYFQGKSVNLECKVANGKEYPILWVKKQDEDVFPLSTGKNLVMRNTAKFDLRCGKRSISLLKNCKIDRLSTIKLI